MISECGKGESVDGFGDVGHSCSFQWRSSKRVTFPAPELPQSVQLPGYNKSAILRTLMEWRIFITLTLELIFMNLKSS